MAAELRDRDISQDEIDARLSAYLATLPRPESGSHRGRGRRECGTFGTVGAVVSRTNLTARPAARSLVATLKSGRYTFRVAALNEKGQSAWSADSDVVRAR